MNKVILLTGATGYLGSRILKKLVYDNYRICVVKREQSNISKIQSISENIKFYNNDEVSLQNLFRENKIDIIIHFATLYGRKGETLFQIKEANLDLPLLILKFALENSVKYFINTGTSLPYLTNHYSLFKNQFSECLEFYSSKITSLNILLEHFYGPKDDKSKFISGIIGKMHDEFSEIELTEGIQLRDFIFVDDVVDAYSFMITNISKFEGFVNLPLGSGEVVTIRQIVEKIKELIGSNTNLLFGKIPMRENELMKSNADIQILNNLGWYPKFNLLEGLKITIQSHDNKK